MINKKTSDYITYTAATFLPIEFSAIYEEATSRGIDETNWAGIDCQ